MLIKIINKMGRERNFKTRCLYHKRPFTFKDNETGKVFVVDWKDIEEMQIFTKRFCGSEISDH